LSNTHSIQGITEADIANYLAHTPGFFERHAELLSSIQLTSPHGQRAVSLQERQMEMLRERNKGLELKIVEMIRHGQENEAIATKLHRWTRAIMLTVQPSFLPQVLVEQLAYQFMIPQAAIRVWGVDERYSDQSFARGVSSDVKILSTSLTLPYCGLNTGFEAVSWLEDPSVVSSVALIPLRHEQAEAAFGLLILGSSDPTRYSAEMGTEFLTRIGEIASAGLTRLLPAA
jgi:uncharacterized protein YigA (DUF484 family)